MNIEKRIHSDWFNLRQVYDNLQTLHEHLNIEASPLDEVRKELRLSVETGLLQYKQAQLGSTEEFIEALNYNTRHFNQLEYQCARTSLLLFVILIQRLLSFGIVPLDQQKSAAPAEEEETKEKEIKLIMEDFRKRAMTEPAFTQRNEVKSILLQFKIYQKELEEMKQLKAKVPEEKLPAILANFQKTFAKRNRKIRDNYNIVLSKETRLEPLALAPGNLRKYQIKTMAPLLLKQGEAASRLRSIFQVAQEERYNIREILDKALKLMKDMRSTLSQEKELMSRWEPAPGGAALVSKGFSKELSFHLGKLISNNKDDIDL